jgi:D-alanine-D-alanine ligase
MSKTKVAVVFGSRSTEHDISIITAIASVIKPLELSATYEPIPIYIDKQGRWYSHPKLKDIALYTTGQIDKFLTKQKPLALQIGDGLKIFWPSLKPKSVKLDVVFPATHGTHGEDGELMGLLEMANVAYVGCNMPSSVIAMDKALAKIVAGHAGITTSKFVWFYSRDFISDNQEVLANLSVLTYPLFVKPVHLGSSIAISRVVNAKELLNAIEVAAHYDDKIIVEEAVKNLIEVTVPIIGNEEPKAAFVEQPVLRSGSMFDFDSKYLRQGKKGQAGAKTATGAQGYSKLPAELPKDLYEKAEQTAINTYKAIGCSGIARVDLLIDSKAKKVYFNEVNPLPGSLYAHNWKKSGMSNLKLVETLIELAQDRFKRKQQLTTSFKTTYLAQY